VRSIYLATIRNLADKSRAGRVGHDFDASTAGSVMITFALGMFTGIVATLAALAVAIQLPLRNPRSNDPEG